MLQVQSTGTIASEDSLKLVHTNSHGYVIHPYCIRVHIMIMLLNLKYTGVWPSTSSSAKFTVEDRDKLKVTIIYDSSII